MCTYTHTCIHTGIDNKDIKPHTQNSSLYSPSPAPSSPLGQFVIRQFHLLCPKPKPIRAEWFRIHEVEAGSSVSEWWSLSLYSCIQFSPLRIGLACVRIFSWWLFIFVLFLIMKVNLVLFYTIKLLTNLNSFASLAFTLLEE